MYGACIKEVPIQLTLKSEPAFTFAQNTILSSDNKIVTQLTFYKP